MKEKYEKITTSLVVIFLLIFSMYLILSAQKESYDRVYEKCDSWFGKNNWIMKQTDCSFFSLNMCYKCEAIK